MIVGTVPDAPYACSNNECQRRSVLGNVRRLHVIKDPLSPVQCPRAAQAAVDESGRRRLRVPPLELLVAVRSILRVILTFELISIDLHVRTNAGHKRCCLRMEIKRSPARPQPHDPQCHRHAPNGLPASSPVS